MRCPPVVELVTVVEEGQGTSAVVDDHVAGCDACRGIIRTLREESEGLTISIGALWMKEQISCPHEDLLLNYVNGDLDDEERDYIEFHLDIVQCPSCQASAGEVDDRVKRRTTRQQLEPALKKSLERSATFMRDKA